MASLFARRAFAALPKAKPAAVQVPFKAAPRAVFSAVPRVRFYSDAIGITEKAQKDLGDIVYVEFPEVGESFEAGDAVGSIESVKAVAEIFSPVSGKVTEVNSALSDEPETLNNDPYGDGWLVQLEVANPADVDALLSKDEYEAFLKESDE